MSDNEPDGVPADDSAGISRSNARSGRWSRANGDGNGADRGSVPRESGQAARPARSSDRSRTGSEYSRDRKGGKEGRGRKRDDRGGAGYGGDERDRRGRDSRRDERGGAGYRGDNRDRGERDGRRDVRGGSSGRNFGSRGRGGQRDSGRPDRDRQDSRASGPTNPQRAPRSWDRTSPRNEGRDRGPRAVEPEIPEDITGHELDRDVWTQLRTLSKDNAEGVAKHLVASAVVVDDDPDKALSHALHAAGRAGRVPAVREALGLVYYRRGEFADALREFRTARRLSGSDHLLPYMVDAERGLGRHERALDLAATPAARRLAEADNIELLIVVSGIRRDLDQPEAAVAVLNVPALQRASTQPWAARLFYAYADALLAAGRQAEAKTWFGKAAAVDENGETDADERLDELEGFVLVDLMDAESGDDVDAAGTPDAAATAQAAAAGEELVTIEEPVTVEEPATVDESYDALTNPFSDD